MDIKDLIVRAYGCAKEKGFLDVDLSVEHHLMLVLSEVGEAVEADRRRRRADIANFDIWNGREHSIICFERYIKDSVEDELSDVCIRLFTMCGAFGVHDVVVSDEMEGDFQEIFGNDSFCERMFYLSRLLCSTSGVLEDDGSDECLPRVVGMALSFLFAMCKHDGIYLMRHIVLKMSYNATRPIRNGKKY